MFKNLLKIIHPLCYSGCKNTSIIAGISNFSNILKVAWRLFKSDNLELNYYFLLSWKKIWINSIYNRLVNAMVTKF